MIYQSPSHNGQKILPPTEIPLSLSLDIEGRNSRKKGLMLSALLGGRSELSLEETKMPSLRVNCHFPRAHEIAATTDKRIGSGSGANLSDYYSPQQVSTRVAFAKRVDSLMDTLSQTTSAPHFKRMPLVEVDVKLGGVVQGVVMRGTVQSIVKLVVRDDSRGLVGSVNNETDGTVSFRLRVTPVQLLPIISLFQNGRDYQVIVGPTDGLSSDHWIVAAAGSPVPKDAAAVYLPRIRFAAYGIRFVGDDLPDSLRGQEFSLDSFVHPGWLMFTGEYGFHEIDRLPEAVSQGLLRLDDASIPELAE